MDEIREKLIKGRFIVFEGLDGSGQTTQVNFLVNFLKKNRIPVFQTKEPTKNSEFGREIRKVLKGEAQINPQGLQELFAKDRESHLKNEIIPNLEQGRIVVSDRYYFSSFAFGSSDGADESWLLRRNKDFLLPDAVFFLDVKPEIAIKRIQNRGGKIEFFERKEKLEKAYNFYKYFLKKFENETRIFYINGEKSPENVFTDIKNIIQKF